MLRTWIEGHARWKKRDLSSGATFMPRMAFMCGAVSGSRAMHSGSDQRNAGRQVGAARLHRELQLPDQGAANPAAACRRKPIHKFTCFGRIGPRSFSNSGFGVKLSVSFPAEPTVLFRGQHCPGFPASPKRRRADVKKLIAIRVPPGIAFMLTPASLQIT